MHRTSTAQSPVRTAQARTMPEQDPLNPVLQNALASLDTQLEHELLRYRRQRALGRGSYTPRPIGPRSHEATLPSTMDGAGAPPPPPPPGFHPTAAMPPLAAIATTTDALAVEPAALELKELAKQYASEVAAVSDQTVAGSPEDYLESSEELLRTLSQEQAEVAAEQSFLQSLLTPLGLGSMLLLLMTSALFGFVIMNPSSISQLLHRSEPIANNGAQPNLSPGGTDAAATNPQPNLASQEFPELALGNLGAIPSEGAGAGVIGVPGAIAQPDAKTTHLGASGIASGSAVVPKVPATPSVNAPEAPSAATAEVPSPRKLAPAPSVDPPPVRTYVPPARSYSPPPRRSYSPPPARAYTPPARRANPPVQPYTPPRAVLPAPKPIPVPVPEVDRTPPPPSPAPTASTSPNASGYRVVTPYTSDKTLEEYRGKVPDAYVKNYSDGAKVQFGAFGDENAAKSQAEELRKQGIPAEVYKP